MSKICPLMSGSTGNSTYITGVKSSILVDAGGSFKAIKTAISELGSDISSLSAVAVTHEHTDHIKGLKALLKSTGVPLIASAETLEALMALDAVPAGTRALDISAEIDLGDIAIARFATSHDCIGSSGYVVRLPKNKKCAICTDLGVVTDEVRGSISGCDAVLLESNHDINMLKRGPYPPQLKLRIMSDVGHISNAACAAELPELLKSGTTRFILGHLSQKNNLPMLALSTAKSALMDAGAACDRDYFLSVAAPSNNGVTVL